MITPGECAEWLLAHDDYLIISHRRPDGDTLFSGAALCSALRRAGKSAWCFDNPETIDSHRGFVAPFTAEPGRTPKTPVTVDVASENLFPAGVAAPIPLAIDHHPTNSRFAESLCLAAERSSCGELVLEIIKALGNGVTQSEADLLYGAVSTDTGCFMYSNTNAATFRAAAELVELGAQNGMLNNALFRSLSRGRLALEGRMLTGMRYFRDGRITAVIITRKMLAECGADENDCDDLAGIAGKARGSWMNFTIREVAEGESKVSARCGPQHNVAELCGMYGGGGHAMAAGVTLHCDPEKALELMLRAVDEKYPEL